MPAYKQVAARLRQRIKDQNMQAGAALPSLGEIQESHGVSVTVARLAIKELKNEGLVTVVPGKGNLVADPKAANKGERFEQAMQLIGTLVERVDNLTERLAAVEAQVAQPDPSAARGPQSGRRGQR